MEHDPVDQVEPQNPGAQGQAKAGGEEEILGELTRLGNAFVQAVQAAWQSDERRKLEQDLGKGLRTLADNVEEALQKVSRNEQVHELLDKAEDVAGSVGEKVRESKVTAEIKDGLVKGLTALTEQLQKVSQDLAARHAAEPPPPPPAADPDPDPEPQDIPIQ